QSLVGPTEPGQVVRTRLQLRWRRIAVHGRVLRADGIPVPQAEVAFVGEHAVFFHDKEQTRDGSLGARVGDFDFLGALPADVDTVEGATLQIEREAWCAHCTVPIARLHAGDNDLGDVVVSAPAGQVLLATVAVRCGDRDVTASAHAYVGAVS